jgi:hypothetical protein
MAKGVGNQSVMGVKYREIIADNLRSFARWNQSLRRSPNSNRLCWIADAHRGREKISPL